MGFEAKLETETPDDVSVSDAKIEVQVQKRLEAKKVKNFAEADRIRDELHKLGITLIDSRDGTRWHRN